MAIQSATICSNSSVVMPACVAMTISSDAPFAAGERALQVALEQRGERLFVLPLGMLRGQRLHAVEREEQLEIHRLLRPQRAVIVEGGDALVDRHEIRRSFLRHFVDESGDGLLGRRVVPRWQGMAAACGHARHGQMTASSTGAEPHRSPRREG